MEAQKKTCAGCNVPRKIWKNHQGERYCQPCWARRAHPSGNKTARTTRTTTPIRPVSVKKAAQDKVYSHLRREFLTLHPCCQAKLVAGCGGCQGLELQVHHKKGRGKYYLIPATWLAVCHRCHVHIETNPELAKALGFSENRLT